MISQRYPESHLVWGNSGIREAASCLEKTKQEAAKLAFLNEIWKYKVDKDTPLPAEKD